MTVFAALPVAALVGVLVLVVVVGGLVYGAISQYRRSQVLIAERRGAREAEAAHEAESRRQDLLREGEFSRLAFEEQRRRVRGERPALVRAALDRTTSPDAGPLAARVVGSSLLMPEAWLLDSPLSLDPGAGQVTVRAEPADGPRRPPALTAALKAARPATSTGVPFEHVVDAIVELESPAPSAYVNRDCFRVVGLRLGESGVALDLARTTFFAALDEAVPLECEVAESMRDTASGALPIREAIGDPSDLAARTVVASVDTLVLRRAPDGGAEFWMHRRRTTGMVQGQTHVVPAGVFQPAIDDLPEIFQRDATPWHTVLRETAEELLGVWDVDSRAVAADAYGTQPPLSDLEAARVAGTVRPWLIGIGLDPLSLWMELLTVLVVDAPTFDELFGDLPRENAEGSILGRTRADGTFGGLPFTQEGIDGALATESLAPAADGLLRLAWKHRSALL